MRCLLNVYRYGAAGVAVVLAAGGSPVRFLAWRETMRPRQRAALADAARQLSGGTSLLEAAVVPHRTRGLTERDAAARIALTAAPAQSMAAA